MRIEGRSRDATMPFSCAFQYETDVACVAHVPDTHARSQRKERDLEPTEKQVMPDAVTSSRSSWSAVITCTKETTFIELMTSYHKRKASREGAK
jgi:hypothetical protein